MSAEISDAPARTGGIFMCINCGGGSFRWKLRSGRRRRVCTECRSSRKDEDRDSPRAPCAIDLPGESEAHREPNAQHSASHGLSGDRLFGILMGSDDGLPLQRKRDGVEYGA